MTHPQTSHRRSHWFRWFPIGILCFFCTILAVTIWIAFTRNSGKLSLDMTLMQQQREQWILNQVKHR